GSDGVSSAGAGLLSASSLGVLTTSSLGALPALSVTRALSLSSGLALAALFLSIAVVAAGLASAGISNGSGAGCAVAAGLDLSLSLSCALSGGLATTSIADTNAAASTALAPGFLRCLKSKNAIIASRATTANCHHCTLLSACRRCCCVVSVDGRL